MENTFKRTYILIFLLALLAGFYYFFDNPAKIEEKSLQKYSAPFFHDFKKENAEKIKIQTGANKEIILEKKGNSWIVASKDNSPANLQNVNYALNSVSTIPTGDIASDDQKQHETFDLTKERGTHVVIKNSKDIDLINFYIGKSGSPTFDSQYIRKENNNSVHRINIDLKSFFNDSEDFWIEKKTEEIKSTPKSDS